MNWGANHISVVTAIVAVSVVVVGPVILVLLPFFEPVLLEGTVDLSRNFAIALVSAGIVVLVALPLSYFISGKRTDHKPEYGRR